MKHFLTLSDFSKSEILEIIKLSMRLKNATKTPPYFRHKILAMIFEKSSTRTRVSFESGIFQLGGYGMFLSNRDIQLGRGEPIKDTARVISSMVDMIVMRTGEYSRLLEFAKYSSVPVINGLSDELHPLQLLADYLTMVECGIYVPFGEILSDFNEGDKPVVAYIGDGNNMAHSWINLASILGFELRIASPKGYEPKASYLHSARDLCEKSGGKIILTDNQQEALKGVNVITTDTWASMGQEEEKDIRQAAFKDFCINEASFENAKENAIFLHCLPAYRGQEVSESVIEGSKSRVFQEANNRLHAQKAVMLYLARINNISLMEQI